ncbi:hypothetical protein BJY16_005310 [Actinoplanes octamycinicus]|uniref:Uncharacterized protein n=1 Tax=Actinoplanes octamycinicus TaxID=135948 RepID=A0A7W7H0R6_9ACTN|nr:hypothetical protein [Actinoplanes octamycinicus]MBB4741851.1 hypothetical protein [Actinoplanes octamycinicus]GIE60615.1 hypothetical protein Aoc01nite_60170 [Actinoplanes octamycinicus]
MHEDFYAVATTVVVFFILGSLYLLHELESMRIGRWAYYLCYTAVLLPGVFVIIVSLQILGGAWIDTAGWREAIRWAVVVQIVTGAGGMLVEGGARRG